MSTQLTEKQLVEVGNHVKCAGDVATELALTLHGLSGWQGVQNNGMYAPSGLKKLANACLRKRSKTAIVIEKCLGDGESHYYPSWK